MSEALTAAEPSAGQRKLIQHGDLVIMYERFDSTKVIKVDKEASITNRFGTFHLKDWIGLEYGSKANCKSGEKWVYLLELTPELWTNALDQRTQILYVADIAMIIFKLELKPGCLVLETGTGSGSLTTSLSRAVAPDGLVATFEFHEQRAQLAKEDFAKLGIDTHVKIEHRDTQENGFPKEYVGKADAVFLDLPSPWSVVESAAACLKPNHMFCSFSPCIEQVHKTCDKLNFYGFRDIHTIEILLREYQVSRAMNLSAIDLVFQQAENKADQVMNASETENGDADLDDLTVEPPVKKAKLDSEENQNSTPVKKGYTRSTTGRPVTVGKGHTGYLTFARKSINYVRLEEKNITRGMVP
eukprot:jgi/Picsp_1/3152/NSC_05992-R1_trna (adenine-n1-)-methyltransferase